MTRQSEKRGAAAANSADDENDVYEMEDIIGYKRDNNIDLFMVKWKGYSSAEATWEPRANIYEPGETLELKMEKLKQDCMTREGATARKRSRLDDDSARVSTASPTKATSNKPVDTEAAKATSQTPSTSTATQAKAVPRVSHVQKNENDELFICVETGDTHDWIGVADGRAKYPQELLTYLLSRVRFRADKT